MKIPKLFCGRNSKVLAQKIANELSTKKGFSEVRLGKIEYKDFADKEIWLRYGENIRGRDVFLIQSTNPPADNLMELLIMIDAAKRASASTINVVIPYFGYARQDRKDQPRVAITSKLVVDMLTVAGTNRIITMDLHAPQIQGFFNIPIDHLYASSIFLPMLKHKKIKNLAIVSPDAGGMKAVRAYATELNADMIMIDKQRNPKLANVCEVMNIIGDPKGKNLVIVDDLIDTGRTLINAVKALKQKGAEDIYILATHAVVSKGTEIFNIDEIKEVFVTDTINRENHFAPDNTTVYNIQDNELIKHIGLKHKKDIPKVKYLSTSKLFAEAIARIFNNESISSLFDTK
jgi:ribose-phosphate pyrophosphokinase